MKITGMAVTVTEIAEMNHKASRIPWRTLILYSGFSFKTTAGVIRGSSIFLFISALAGNGALSNSSLKFVQYVVLNNINMSEFGMTPLSTCLLFNDTSPPTGILNMVQEGKLRLGGSIQ